jgi:hypothetical protein
MEVSYIQLILKDYMKNMQKSFKNVYERLNEVNFYNIKADGCFCTKNQVGLEEVDFKSGVKNFSLLKASNNKRAKNLSYNDRNYFYINLVKKESLIENNLKSTNNRTNFTKLDDVNNQLIFKSVIFYVTPVT